MIGVTNPGGSVRPRKEVYAAVASLAIGYSISTAFVALVLTTVAAVVPHYFSDSLRLGAVISVLILFGLADLTGRTPMTQRQVPQVFARTLGVAPRNLLWGLDLGLLITTQKTSSLIWIGITTSLIVERGQILTALVPLVAAVAFLGAYTAAAVSKPEWKATQRLASAGLNGTALETIRVASGAFALAIAATLAVSRLG
ncbi:MAG: hypothetical protein QOI54_807 [Actinomycetota bacterium]|jgi:hypothetical protein|nr:hypothetical protein [Actinomycetota bacterium]